MTYDYLTMLKIMKDDLEDVLAGCWCITMAENRRG